jgi:hypothetical protein
MLDRRRKATSFLVFSALALTAFLAFCRQSFIASETKVTNTQPHVVTSSDMTHFIAEGNIVEVSRTRQLQNAAALRRGIDIAVSVSAAAKTKAPKVGTSKAPKAVKTKGPKVGKSKGPKAAVSVTNAYRIVSLYSY